MPRKRSSKNSNLPAYVMRRSGRFYLEPKGRLLDKLGGKKSFPLGQSYVDMFYNYKKIMSSIELMCDGQIYTISQLIDRYLLEVTPKKSEDGQRREIRRASLLRKVFGHMYPEDLTKAFVYRFIDKRSAGGAPVGVNRDVALLAAIYKKAERWGVVEKSPCIGLEYNKETARTRYITHAEYTAFREFVRDRHEVFAWYMDFKYLTGLRACDIRKIKRCMFEAEGIRVRIGKLGNVERLIRWSSALRMVTEQLLLACGRERKDKCGRIKRQRVESEYLFFTRTGGAYTEDGFRAIFYRLMRKAVEQGVLQEAFPEHDIRAKAGSDQESLEKASKFLAHLNVSTTARHYRRKLEVIEPLM